MSDKDSSDDDSLRIDDVKNRPELTAPGDVAELAAAIVEEGKEQAQHHAGNHFMNHRPSSMFGNHDHGGEGGRRHGGGGLNESMQIRFQLDDSKRSDDGDGKNDHPASPTGHKANYQDYLAAQRSLKMKGMRHLSYSKPSRNLVAPEDEAHEKQKRAISIVGKRHSMMQDGAAWQSFLKEVEESDMSDEGEEDGDTDDGKQSGGDDHHRHGNATIPFYCVPVQRQRWGDDQMLPHINWGDIFFDLFYVAAAYNLGVLLISAMNEEDWSRGVVYFIGIFGPLYQAWENDLYYSSRYTVVDHFHRLFDVFRFLLVASVVLHIKTFDALSDAGSRETLALMASFTLEAIMTLLQNVELVLYAVGDRTAIINHTTRKIQFQYIPMVMVYLITTIVAAVYYAQSLDGETDHGYGSSNDGYGDYDDGSDYNSNKTEYGKEKNTTYAVDYDIYNTTGALEGGHRGLAAAEDDSSYADEGAEWSTADIPYLLCFCYYVLNVLFTSVRKLMFARDKAKDIRDYFVPNNIDYLIHRYGEWTMLMIGESVLSLLIVETVDSRDYYITAYLGALTVIILQILKFESEPSHSDGHALWRSMEAAVCFSVLVQILSMGLIAFGVSYKVMLTTIATQVSTDSDYGGSACGDTVYDDDYHRILGGAELCPEDGKGHRLLAAVPTITGQATAALFCGSLAIVVISLEFMLLSHAGFAKNYKRIFKMTDNSEGKHIDLPLLFIGSAKVLIILFTATISQWEIDPTSLTIFGFIIVSALAVSRVVCWGLVHRKEQLKRLMSIAKERAKVSTKGAAQAVKRATSKVAASIASSRHSEAASITDYDRAVWDSSFDAIVVTDPTGIIRHVNHTCLMVFGYEDANELIGHNISALVGGGEAENHSNYLEDFRKSKKTSSTIGKQRVLFSRRKDGSEFPCIVGIKHMPGSDDLIGYIRNTIGLDKEYTKEAKILDPVQQLMDDTSFDSILATTKDGEIIACNMTTLSEFGYYHKDDLIGENISTLVGGPHAAKHGKYMDRFQKKNKSETILGKQRVLRARRHDESEFDCLIRINTIPDTDGLLVGYIRNIDGVSKKQRKLHAEEMSAMSRSSMQEDDLIDESFDSIIVANEKGIIQRVNLTALDMFRYDRKDELVGQNLSILVGGDMAEKHDMFLKRFAESGKSESTIGQQRVLKALRKDGSEFKCIIGIKVMRNTHLLVGYIRDVSELESVRNSVNITNLNILDPVERLVDDDSFDAIIVIDSTGVMKRVNATAVKEFEYDSKDELEGKNVSILVGGGMADKHDNLLKRFRERGDSSSTIGKQRILYSKRKDGTEFPAIIGIRQIPDTDYLVGHIKNMTGLSIHDKKKSMKHLDILKHVDDTSFDSIVVIHKDGSIVQVNATAVGEFGYDRKEEMVSLNISALVGGGQAENHDQYLANFEKQPDRTDSAIGKRRRLFAKRKDATEFSCIVGIKRLPDSDYLIGYISNTSDM